MSTSHNALYMPYGAYELKSSYQRNMLVGTVIVCLIVLSGLFLAWSLSVLSGPGSTPDPGGTEKPIITVIDIPNPVSIQKMRTRPEVSTPPAANVDVGIPKPVPDDSFEDEGVMLISRDELADLIDGTDALHGGLEHVAVYEDPPAEQWTMDSFVVAEIRPEMIYRHLPRYPRLLEQAGITGDVVVWALVNEKGEVAEARVFKSSGSEGLDEAAVAAAYLCRYSPGIQNGRPIKVPVIYSVEFRLEG